MREDRIEPDFITSAEAARILGRAPDTVRWMARTRRIPVAVQTSAGIRLFSRRLVEAIAAKRRGEERTATRSDGKVARRDDRPAAKGVSRL